eukprot:2917175-Pyramimonas_sp.AAC.1
MVESAKKIKADHAAKKRRIDEDGQAHAQVPPPAQDATPEAPPQQQQATDPEAEKRKAEAIAKLIEENKERARAASQRATTSPSVGTAATSGATGISSVRAGV